MSDPGLSHLFEVTENDRQVYASQLADFLPAQIIDIHTHVWLKSFVIDAPAIQRGAQWPRLVAEDNSIEDLVASYQRLLPQQKVIPMLFGNPVRHVAIEENNPYVSRVAQQRNLPSLMVSLPEWSPAELEHRVNEGGFLGLKPYLDFAPENLPSAAITIFDFLPHSHLQIAHEHSWIVMLHLPRPQRLRDPLNLAHLLEIERRYPGVKLIVAHIGRAYCPEDVGMSFEVLSSTERMMFDFSANTNAQVMEQLMRAVGPKRILFGSDMPIVRMRMRRICEQGRYINLVPPGLYGDVSGDVHMRAVSQAEGAGLTLFLYEELLAFRRAAEAAGLDTTDIEDIFHHNAARTIAEARAAGSSE